MRVCLHSDSGAAAREDRAGGAEGCQRSDRQLSEGASTHPYKHTQTHTDRQNTQPCLTAIHTVIFMSKNRHKSQNTRGQRSQALGIVTFPLATHHHSLLSCICTFAIRRRFNLNKNNFFLINCALCLDNFKMILKSKNQWLEKILAYCAQHVYTILHTVFESGQALFLQQLNPFPPLYFRCVLSTEMRYLLL